MKKETYEAFDALRREYKAMIESITREYPDLPALAQKLVDSRDEAPYAVETAAVYNGAMDGFGPDGRVGLILAGDNPGRREQAARAYLVGPSGKIAERFFAANAAFGIDFRRDVLILNKTPLHTPRTADLKTLRSLGGERIAGLIRESQIACADLLYRFWAALSREGPLPVWIIGYSEMRKGGLFEHYARAVRERAERDAGFYAALRLYRHFSMNQFTSDLNKRRAPDEPLAGALDRVGAEYRARILR